MLTLNSLLTSAIVVVVSLFSVNGAFSQELAPQDTSQEKESIQPLAAGDAAPDFELEGLNSKKVKLSDRFGDNGKPVILLFSRANW